MKPQTLYRCPICGEPSSRPTSHVHYRNGKRYPIAYVVPFVVVVLLLFAIVPAAYVAHNTVQRERTAILPVKVWEHLVDDPKYQCWILPGETYTVADNYSVGYAYTFILF